MSDQEIEYAALLKRRHRISTCFEWVCRIATVSALVFLAVLLAGVIWQAWGWLDTQFLTGFDSLCILFSDPVTNWLFLHPEQRHQGTGFRFFGWL